MNTITESLARIEAGHQKLFTLVVRPIAAIMAKKAAGADFSTAEGFARFLDSLAIPLISKDKESLVRIKGKQVFCGAEDITRFLDPEYIRFLKTVVSKSLPIKFSYAENGSTRGQAEANHSETDFTDPAIRFFVSERRRLYFTNIVNNGSSLASAFDSLFFTKDNRDTFVHELHHIFQYASRHVTGMIDDGFQEGLMKHLRKYNVGKNLATYILNPRELEAHFVHGLQNLVHEFSFPPLNPYGGPHDDFRDMPSDPEGYLKRRSMSFRIMGYILLYQPSAPTPQYLNYYRSVRKMYEGMLTDFEEAVARSKHADF